MSCFQSLNRQLASRSDPKVACQPSDGLLSMESSSYHHGRRREERQGPAWPWSGGTAYGDGLVLNATREMKKSRSVIETVKKVSLKRYDPRQGGHDKDKLDGSGRMRGAAAPEIQFRRHENSCRRWGRRARAPRLAPTRPPTSATGRATHPMDTAVQQRNHLASSFSSEPPIDDHCHASVLCLPTRATAIGFFEISAAEKPRQSPVQGLQSSIRHPNHVGRRVSGTSS